MPVVMCAFLVVLTGGLCLSKRVMLWLTPKRKGACGEALVNAPKVGGSGKTSPTSLLFHACTPEIYLLFPLFGHSPAFSFCSFGREVDGRSYLRNKKEASTKTQVMKCDCPRPRHRIGSSPATPSRFGKLVFGLRPNVKRHHHTKALLRFPHCTPHCQSDLDPGTP